MTQRVALLKADDYDEASLRPLIWRILEEARLPLDGGPKVLIKPNLILANELACANPQLTALACEWLLEKGAKVIVADSPAFGTARSVARAIGLAALLDKYGLEVRDFSSCRTISLPLPQSTRPVKLGVAAEALDCDLILSIPRVKAHSQMRLTLSVKNCFGCVYGIRKAIAHLRFGKSVEFFSDCVAALLECLPPVAALCDGIVAMDRTGPRNGDPFRLRLIGASVSAAALDAAILSITGFAGADIPLARALERRGVYPLALEYPLRSPEDFDASAFRLPVHLKDISFNPLVLTRSIFKRLWLGRKRQDSSQNGCKSLAWRLWRRK